MPSSGNAEATLRALARFGAPLNQITKEDLLQEGTIFQVGVAPRRIDLITSASGLTFEDAARRSQVVDISGIPIRVLSLADLIVNKRASGRTKDIADVEALERISDSEPET
ncbi:MAG: hypothetical protein M5U15_05015 [Kiritimatiellae bacterium]|nr:hypothetical protein [Kiritimatiellia bacterium]